MFEVRFLAVAYFTDMRAIRRHHIKRLKKKRFSYYQGGAASNDRILGIVTTTPKLCSCTGCGNPRKWFRKKTRQELAAELELEEYYEDTNRIYRRISCI